MPSNLKRCPFAAAAQGCAAGGILAHAGSTASLCHMPSAHSATSLPPRVLLVMPEQWPRALLRAALREAGYDALGASGLATALRYPTRSPDRGLVRLILIDQAALADEESATLLNALFRRHGNPAPVLLARAMPAHPLPPAAAPARWRRVIRRPASIAELVAAVQALLPLPPGSGRPIE
jgi:DNA-binding response OmpR family regulator